MSLIKGLSNDIKELYIAKLPLSALYKGDKLIWSKNDVGTNLLTADNFALISKDGFILICKE